jgi:hypothetical protein
MGAEKPVLLMCSHPEAGQAWWMHVQGWFSAEVSAAVLRVSASVSVATAQNFVFGLRAFPRFCFLEGLIGTSLSDADVRAILAGCDRRTARKLVRGGVLAGSGAGGARSRRAPPPPRSAVRAGGPASPRWVLPEHAAPTHWAQRLAVARGFAGYLKTIDPATEVPPSGVACQKASPRTLSVV